MNVKLRLKQYIKMAAQNLYLPAVYHLYAWRQVQKDLILLADAHHNSRPESMELLAEELIGRGYTVEEMYLDYGRASVGQTLAHMTRFMKRYAQAGTVVICDNFLPAAGCRKKKETKLIQLWHACGALKKFGYDTTDDIPANYRGNVFAGTDLVTVSAPFCEKPFAGAMRLPAENVQAMGVSRSDRFFDEKWQADCRQRFEQAFGDQLQIENAGTGREDADAEKALRRKVVLWAPTFRGSPGAPDCIALDIAGLQRQLGDEYLVIESRHPHMQTEITAEQASLTTEELFASTDILVADYSSLLFEYCLYGKPLVLYTPDFAEYTARRGFYMDYEDIPGIRVDRESELAETIRRAEREGMDAQKQQLFLQRYMSSCDGQATKRIADYISRG